jgi:hypothetical protein
MRKGRKGGTVETRKQNQKMRKSTVTLKDNNFLEKQKISASGNNFSTNDQWGQNTV